MVNALYTLLIYPLVLIVELCYRVFMAVVASEGVAILAVSVAITLLCLPLYAVAEKHQTAERETQKKLAPGVARIKKAFHGDEGYMVLSTFYRENHYSPIMQLRSSFGLLIQVPFFIAAYSFLSKCPELLGKRFLFIRDLGLPDALFSLGGFRVNVLPTAMTAINIAAGAIYSKGHGAREKVQIYAMAIVFLVILYQSPAGLVLYWTANNLFSLVKNVFYKLANPLKAFWALCTAALVAFTSYLLAKGFERVEAFVLATVVVASLPWLLKVAKKAFDKVLDAKPSFAQFFICAFSLAIFVGVVVPSFLMTDSPAEYCYLEGGGNPLPFLANSALQALGLFVVWPGCVYFLFGKKFKCALSFAFFLALVLALIDNFAFPGDYGNVLPEIEFTEHKSLFPTPLFFALNSVAVLVAAGGVWTLYHFHLKKSCNTF